MLNIAHDAFDVFRSTYFTVAHCTRLMMTNAGWRDLIAQIKLPPSLSSSSFFQRLSLVNAFDYATLFARTLFSNAMECVCTYDTFAASLAYDTLLKKEVRTELFRMARRRRCKLGIPNLFLKKNAILFLFRLNFNFVGRRFCFCILRTFSSQPLIRYLRPLRRGVAHIQTTHFCLCSIFSPFCFRLFRIDSCWIVYCSPNVFPRWLKWVHVMFVVHFGRNGAIHIHIVFF